MPVTSAATFAPAPSAAASPDATAGASLSIAQAHPADTAEHMHASGKSHPLSHKLMWGAGIAAAAIIALPYLGQSTNLFGAAGGPAAIDAFTACSGKMAQGFLAPALTGIIEMLPFGAALAAGGWVPVVASFAISIGGRMLANYLEKKEHEHPGAFPWSKVVRVTATATSMLISLPGILTGISMGLSFLGQLATERSAMIAPSAGNSILGFIRDHSSFFTNLSEKSMEYLGSVGGRIMVGQGSISSSAFLLSHTVSCAVPLLGVGIGETLPAKNSATSPFAARIAHQRETQQTATIGR